MRLSVCLFRSCSSSSDTQALLGIFGNLYFGKKKKTHPFERLQESETRRNYILKIGFGFGVSSLEKLLIVGSLRFQQLC